jgi:hypothetical protein
LVEIKGQRALARRDTHKTHVYSSDLTFTPFTKCLISFTVLLLILHQ